MKKTSAYIVLTDDADLQKGHVPLVQPHMDQPFVHINPAVDILANKGIGIVPREGHLECLYEGRPLNNIKSVWVRRPASLKQGMVEGVDKTFRSYSFQTIRRHTLNIYDLWQDAFWVSNDYAVTRAEHKPLQLAEAYKVGLRVPETLFASSEHDAKEFIKKHKEVIVKSLGATVPEVGQDALIFFSTRISPKTKIDYSKLNYAPAIFQKAIDAAYDLRITVIGDKVFTATIQDDIEKTIKTRVRDWRVGMYAGNLDIQPFDNLPKDVEKACKELVRNLGLACGMIDMVVDKKPIY